MLGKDHINISMAFILPFLITLFFLNIGNATVIVVFIFAVLVGSILPDTDCGGNATIYYRFPEIDRFMKKVVGKFLIYSFNFLISKNKLKTEYEVRDEHRGLLHSPIGVLLTSLILVLPILIFSLIFNLFNLIILVVIFFGLLLGQLLHLLEDSCTVSGINWGFPFRKKELKGEIYTFQKYPGKKDIRPMLYSGFLYFLILLLILGYSFKKLEIWNIYLVFSLIFIYEIVMLFLFVIISRSKASFWLINSETLKKMKKHSRRIANNSPSI
jgi:membrane-bound metal-dependent hydrolase YbcI (DUF457 family)